MDLIGLLLRPAQKNDTECLARMGLDRPSGLRDRIYARLIRAALSA